MSRTLSGWSVSSLACPVGTSSSLLASLYASSHSPVRGPGSGPRRIARRVILPPAFVLRIMPQSRPILLWLPLPIGLGLYGTSENAHSPTLGE
jgi:hypothetical protein